MCFFYCFLRIISHKYILIRTCMRLYCKFNVGIRYFNSHYATFKYELKFMFVWVVFPLCRIEQDIMERHSFYSFTPTYYNRYEFHIKGVLNINQIISYLFILKYSIQFVFSPLNQNQPNPFKMFKLVSIKQMGFVFFVQK